MGPSNMGNPVHATSLENNLFWLNHALDQGLFIEGTKDTIHLKRAIDKVTELIGARPGNFTIEAVIKKDDVYKNIADK